MNIQDVQTHMKMFGQHLRASGMLSEVIGSPGVYIEVGLSSYMRYTTILHMSLWTCIKVMN
jgi:hypothetical protein